MCKTTWIQLRPSNGMISRWDEALGTKFDLENVASPQSLRHSLSLKVLRTVWALKTSYNGGALCYKPNYKNVIHLIVRRCCCQQSLVSFDQTNDCWPMIRPMTFIRYHHSQTDRSVSTNQTCETIDWQTTITQAELSCSVVTPCVLLSRQSLKNGFGKFIVCNCLLCFALGIWEPPLLSSFHQ